MLRVVTYHRVAEPGRNPLLNPRLVSAPPAVFEQHLRHLARRYHVVSLAEVLDAVQRRIALPRRAVLITFDDGYRDFLDAAWPLLEAQRLPAIQFVPTAYPGEPQREFWWDRLYRSFTFTSRTALDGTPLGRLELGSPAARRTGLAAVQETVKRLPHAEGMALVDHCVAALGDPGDPGRAVLSWDELRDLQRRGLSVCAHSRTHPLLTRVAPETVRDEVAGSLADLKREMGGTSPVFSYPNGAHDDTTVAVLRGLGVELAFTQVDGHNALQRLDPLRLRRTNITRRSSPAVFRLRLLHYVTYVDRWRHRDRSPAGLA
jgi:peptidoglycan/xylan/chitin deacetylase (PgdA/CDA1 family)